MEDNLVIKDITAKDLLANPDFELTILDTNHLFLDGMYLRQTDAKAGTLVIGAEHKNSCFAILAKGKIKQIDGDKSYEIEAPAVIITQPNSNRKALVIEDCSYITVARAESTNVVDVEKELYKDTPFTSSVQEDYSNMLEELGFTEEFAQSQVNIDNVVEDVNDNYYLSDSNIHGTGVFASKDFKIGDKIGAGSLDSKYRTFLGRYTNHSQYNNVEFLYEKDGNVTMYATKSITKGNEMFLNYRNTLVESRRRTVCQLG